MHPPGFIFHSSIARLSAVWESDEEDDFEIKDTIHCKSYITKGQELGGRVE